MVNSIFRGKRLDNGVWVHSGNMFHFNEEEGEQLYFIPGLNEPCTATHDENDNIVAFTECILYKVDPDTVGRCTNAFDSQGVPAFEGDCIKNHLGSDIGVIRYGAYKNTFNDDIHAQHIGFYVEWHGAEAHLLRKDLGFWLSLPMIQIIGNVYDNPELLNGTENGAES